MEGEGEGTAQDEKEGRKAGNAKEGTEEKHIRRKLNKLKPITLNQNETYNNETET